MTNVITELSKYVILTLMVIYTFHCFYMVYLQSQEERNNLLNQQLILIIFMNLTAFAVLFLKKRDIRVIVFCGAVMLFYLIIQVLYRCMYKRASFLLLNNMCMLLSVGFIMLCRLNVQTAFKQLAIVGTVSVGALIIPVLIRKMKFLKYLTWIYAAVGIALLAAVLVLAQTSYGAKLTLFGIQPSEVIKITYVFFLAALLSKRHNFQTVMLAGIAAGAHVIILVLSTDLGSAVIFFVTFLVMVYVSTKKPVYLGLGLAGGSVASIIAYRLFGHVRQRVSAWRNPLAVYQNEGYQIVQS